MATDDDEFDDADIDEEDVDGKTDAVAKHTLEEDEDDVHINPVFAMVSTPKSKLHSHVHAHVESTGIHVYRRACFILKSTCYTTYFFISISSCMRSEVTVVHLSDEDFRTECKNLMTEFFQLLDVNEAIARLKVTHVDAVWRSFLFMVTLYVVIFLCCFHVSSFVLTGLAYIAIASFVCQNSTEQAGRS